jgi:hypothetical protein
LERTTKVIFVAFVCCSKHHNTKPGRNQLVPPTIALMLLQKVVPVRIVAYVEGGPSIGSCPPGCRIPKFTCVCDHHAFHPCCCQQSTTDSLSIVGNRLSSGPHSPIRDSTGISRHVCCGFTMCISAVTASKRCAIVGFQQKKRNRRKNGIPTSKSKQ